MKKSVISLVIAAALGMTAVPFGTAAETASKISTYTVTFLDFDGKPFYTMAVPAGYHFTDESISQLDTSSLNKQIDKHTQQRFSSWWGIPEYIYADVNIKPLSVIGTISLEKLPDKKQYYSLESEISKSGLSVNITFETQTGIDSSGNYTTKKEVIDISSTCTMNYTTAGDAFKSGNKATIQIYPIHSTQPIGSYEISYTEGIGDVDNDDVITGSDATKVLHEYTLLSSDPSYKIDEAVVKYGDMDFNGILNGSDATILLRYYTLKSSDPEYNLDMFFDAKNENHAE